MTRDDDERAPDLAALWPAPEPRPDFVARVQARLREPTTSDRGRPPARRPRWWAAALLAVAAGVIGVVVVLAGRPAPTSALQGAAAPTERVTIGLGRRGVVVAEPGAVLAWSVAADGHAVVQLSAGAAFFRVEPGGRFVVETPSGQVRVTGTCFTVAVAADRTSVEVHEGRVELVAVGAGEPVALAPGERGHVGGGAPARRRPIPLEVGEAPAAVAAAPDRSGRTLAPQARPADQCYCLSDPTSLEADQARLDAWATMCRVRADLPPLDEPAVEVMSDQLGLVGEERRAFAEAARELAVFGEARVREIYVVATGDQAGAPTLDVDAMIEQIVRAAPLDDEARIRRLLSAERAGRQAPVVDPEQMTPLEEFFRLVVGGGDEFERRLAARLGAARARELRRRFGGWPGPNFDWLGCP